MKGGRKEEEGYFDMWSGYTLKTIFRISAAGG